MCLYIDHRDTIYIYFFFILFFLFLFLSCKAYNVLLHFPVIECLCPIHMYIHNRFKFKSFIVRFTGQHSQTEH